MLNAKDKTVLLADIGGTNARFAINDGARVNPASITKYPTADYANIELAIDHYLRDQPAIDAMVIAMAGVALSRPDTQYLYFSNNRWHFSVAELGQRFNLQSVTAINDFAAQALAITALGEHHLQVLHQGVVRKHQTQLAIGPGTGLGVCAVCSHISGAIALSAEGGHVSFAPTTPRQFALYQYLNNPSHGVSVEDIVAGPGLARVYRALSAIDGGASAEIKPSEVVEKAANGEPRALETLEIAIDTLGRAISDAALLVGALGGIYLAGGVLPKILPVVGVEALLKAIYRPSKQADYLSQMPLYLVRDEYAALTGCLLANNNPPQASSCWLRDPI